MTVAQLIQQLQNLDADDAEVRYASQPQWPFENEIAAVAQPERNLYVVVDAGEWWVKEDRPGEEAAGPFGDEPEAEAWIAEAQAEAGAVVYLYEGSQLGYLPGFAREGFASSCW